MILDFAAVDAYVFFQLPFGHLESVAQRDIQIFMGLFVVVVAADHDMLLGNREINPDAIEVTLMLMVVFGGDSDLATDDVVAELLQFGHFLAHLGFDSIGMWKASERDL